MRLALAVACVGLAGCGARMAQATTPAASAIRVVVDATLVPSTGDVVERVRIERTRWHRPVAVFLDPRLTLRCPRRASDCHVTRVLLDPAGRVADSRLWDAFARGPFWTVDDGGATL